MVKTPTVRIVMNSAGAKELLQSDEVMGLLTEKAELIQSAAGGAPDFEVLTVVGAARARATVITASSDGRQAEAENRTLSNALDAARG